MSHDRSGPTRRGFLGTATVATAATMAIPPASQAQTPSGPFVLTQSEAAKIDTATNAPAKPRDWTQPAAMAIPKDGYFKYEQGRYGPVFPRTPANYGFTIIAKVKPGREEKVRAHGKTIEDAIAGDPTFLAPLKLHYLRWLLFPIGSDTYFMFQGIFDTDFDKYTEDAVALFGKAGISTVFENLEGFPMDWKTNAPAFVKFVRDHHYPSFLEYGEYPYATADEIKKALRLKAAFSTMLDQMQ